MLHEPHGRAEGGLFSSRTSVEDILLARRRREGLVGGNIYLQSELTLTARCRPQ